MANEPENCKHESYDLSWSHGELPRCNDCGAVGEFGLSLNDIKWNDPLMMPLRLAEGNDMAGAQHAINYLSLAHRQGFKIYTERLKNLTAKDKDGKTS